MTTWYVREDTSHSGTRNGTSYATAWGGWGEIVWGAGGVLGGDTLYTCGAHTSASNITPGNSGATQGNETIVRGDAPEEAGSFTFSGTAYFNISRDHFKFYNFTIAGASGATCVFIDDGDNLLFDGLTLTTGIRGISFSGNTGKAHSDVTINGCTFNGVGRGVYWLCSNTAAISSCTNFTITNNTFTTIANSAIEFRSESDVDVSSILTNFIVTDNTFTSCGTSGNPTVYFDEGHLTAGTFKKITFTDNTFTSCGSSSSGGGAQISGFGPTVAGTWGDVYIADNTFTNMVGPTGGLNVFYLSYGIIENNTVTGCTTGTIDGNGILVDNGNTYVIVRRNTCSNNVGASGANNSGCAVMVLLADHIYVYGNIGTGNKHGIFCGGNGANTACYIYNNTFTDCSNDAVYVASTQTTPAQYFVYNNILTGATGAEVAVDNDSGSTITINNNVFYKLASNEGQTAGSSDLTSDPKIQSYIPTIGSPAISAGSTVPLLAAPFRSAGFDGRKIRQSSPSIGAYEMTGGRPIYITRTLRS